MVIVAVTVTYVAAQTMQIRTYEVKGWPILVLLLIIRTSTQDLELTGTEHVVAFLKSAVDYVPRMIGTEKTLLYTFRRTQLRGYYVLGSYLRFSRNSS